MNAPNWGLHGGGRSRVSWLTGRDDKREADVSKDLAQLKNSKTLLFNAEIGELQGWVKERALSSENWALTFWNWLIGCAWAGHVAWLHWGLKFQSRQNNFSHLYIILQYPLLNPVGPPCIMLKWNVLAIKLPTMYMLGLGIKMILKIEDQRSKITQRSRSIWNWSRSPKRSRSPVVILKIKMRDHNLAHLCSGFPRFDFDVSRRVKSIGHGGVVLQINNLFRKWRKVVVLSVYHCSEMPILDFAFHLLSASAGSPRALQTSKVLIRSGAFFARSCHPLLLLAASHHSIGRRVWDTECVWWSSI